MYNLDPHSLMGWDRQMDRECHENRVEDKEGGVTEPDILDDVSVESGSSRKTTLYRDLNKQRT